MLFGMQVGQGSLPSSQHLRRFRVFICVLPWRKHYMCLQILSLVRILPWAACLRLTRRREVDEPNTFSGYICYGWIGWPAHMKFDADFTARIFECQNKED